jgi:probable rRNA maturation factor
VQEKLTVTIPVEQTITAVLSKAIEVLALDADTEVSIVLADDDYIQELNRTYRGKDMPTDVLSFALNEGEEPEIVDAPTDYMLGDIVISLETAQRQAQEFGHGLEREVAYLAVHGMLHLLGFDHETDQDRQAMRAEEERILTAVGITRE